MPLLRAELKWGSWEHEQGWEGSEKLRLLCSFKALTYICPCFLCLERFYILHICILFYLLKQKDYSWLLLEFTFKHTGKSFTPKL